MNTLPYPTSATWNPAPPRRQAAAAAVLLLHVALALVLLQAGHRVVRQLQPAPIEVSVVEAAKPAPPAAVPLPTPRATLPLPQALTLPLPEFVTTSPARDVAASSEPPPALPSPLRTETTLPRSADATPPPTPKPVAATSLRGQIEPAVEVPRLSRRAGEQGRVQLAVVFDAEGRPASVQLLRGSGFARLDAQALEAIRVARITPYVEDGRPLPVSTVVNLEYELG